MVQRGWRTSSAADGSTCHGRLSIPAPNLNLNLTAPTDRATNLQDTDTLSSDAVQSANAIQLAASPTGQGLGPSGNMQKAEGVTCGRRWPQGQRESASCLDPQRPQANKERSERTRETSALEFDNIKTTLPILKS